MKHICLSIASIIVNISFAQKTEKVYFFGDHDFIASNTQLVVFVKDPQTQIAKDIGQKIYFDTAELRIIQSSFVKEVDPEYQIVHNCDYDVFFYIKTNQNLRYYGSMNSNCGLDGFDCNVMNLLDSLGTPIKRQLEKHNKKTLDQNIHNEALAIFFGPFSQEKSTYFSVPTDNRSDNAINLQKSFFEGYFMDTLLAKKDDDVDELIQKHILDFGLNNPKGSSIEIDIPTIDDYFYIEKEVRIPIKVYTNHSIFLLLKKPATTWIPQASNDKYYWVFRPIATNK